jgi:hypothetical protein
MQSQPENQADSVGHDLPKGPLFERVFGTLKTELEKLSKRDARDVLKAICGIHDLKVSSAFAPVGQIQRTPPSGDTRGEVKPRMQPTADPKVKAIRLEVASLNRQISKKSADIKGKLPMDDPLIQKRAECFRRLKEVQNTRPEALKEGSQESF